MMRRLFCAVLAIGLALGGTVVQAEEPALCTWDVDGLRASRCLLTHEEVRRQGTARVRLPRTRGNGPARGATHHFHETWPEAIVVYMQGLNTPGKLTDPEGKKSGWQSGPGDQKDRDLKSSTPCWRR